MATAAYRVWVSAVCTQNWPGVGGGRLVGGEHENMFSGTFSTAR